MKTDREILLETMAQIKVLEAKIAEITDREQAEREASCNHRIIITRRTEEDWQPHTIYTYEQEICTKCNRTFRTRNITNVPGEWIENKK